MPRLNDETRRLLDDTIERLEAVREDLASEPEDVLRSFMAEEVERSMSKLDPTEHAAFLEELHSRFPSVSESGAANASAPGVTDAPARRRSRERAEPAVEPSPEVTREASPEPASDPDPMPTERAQPAPGAAAVAGRIKVDARLAKALGLRPGDEIDAERAVEMLGLMAEMTKGLDQVMWSTWKVLSPRSGIKGAGEVTRQMGSYASGRGEVEGKDVQRSVERLRQLSAAIVSAISQTGRQFAQQHAERFGPEQIEAWSAREKKAAESGAAAAWRKYKEMYGTADQATIEREIMQQIADYGERLLTGLDRVETKG